MVRVGNEGKNLGDEVTEGQCYLTGPCNLQAMGGSSLFDRRSVADLEQISEVLLRGSPGCFGENRLVGSQWRQRS